MRVLFVSADFVWPPVRGGRVRTLSQLRVLASLDEVEHIDLFSLREEPVTQADRETLAAEIPKLSVLEPVFHAIHLFRYPRYVPRVVWLRVANGVPYVAGKWEAPAVRHALARELATRSADVVWMGGLGITRYLPLVRRLRPDARVVLDGHEVDSDKFAQFAERQRGIKRALAEAEWRRAREFERQTLRAVDAVGAISGDDARAYRELAGIEAVMMPTVVPIVPRVSARPADPRFCYVGNLGWHANARGLDWLCREVWPLVRERRPDATLDIVGFGLPADASGRVVVPGAWEVPGVTTHGYVADIAAVYARALAVVAPTLGGTGVRMKLLEAFAHGAPVVTTPDGASGLPLVSGREAYVEDDPARFADRMLQLASSEDLRRDVRDAAYAFLEQRHGVGAAQAAARALLGIESPGSRELVA